MRSALAIARAAAREHAPLLALLSLALGGAAAASGIDGVDPGSPERARTALGWGLSAAELAAVLAAALLPALGLSRDLHGGLAALLFTRRLHRGELALGRFLAALASATLAAASALAGALAVSALLLGPGAIAGLAPRDEFGASGARIDIAAGESLPWSFPVPDPLREGEGSLRLRPRYQLIEGIPANRGGVVRLRITPEADGVTLAALTADVPTLGAADVVLPPGALRAREARLTLANETPGSVIVFGPGGLALRGPPRSLVLAALEALLGIACGAAFVASVATFGASFMSEWVAVLLALALLTAARAPEDVRGFVRQAIAHVRREAEDARAARAKALGVPAASLPVEAPPAGLVLAQGYLETVIAAVPDLARSDLAAPLLDGRTADARALRDAPLAPLPWIAGALIAAAILLRGREAGLGREEVA